VPQASRGRQAQTGTACDLTPIGSLRRVGHRLLFSANSGIASFTVSTYRITINSGWIRFVRLAKVSVAPARSLLVARSARAPILVDAISRTDGFFLHQRFLVPAGQYRRPLPGQLTGLACDGTVATMLTPAFGGPRRLPLRVQVRSPGRLTVSLALVGGRTLYRRIVTSRHKRLVVSFAPSDLAPGIYTVTVSAQRSPLRHPLVLAALAL
jgi:hypothetical protein